jgi:hypothetical protein
MIKGIILSLLLALSLPFFVHSQDNPQENNRLNSPLQMLFQAGYPNFFSGATHGKLLKSETDFASLADSAHQSKYDTIALTFNVSLRTYFVHDSGGLVVQKLNTSPDKSGNWKNYSRDTLSYTGFLLNKIVSQQWDSQLSAWKNKLKYDYFYDTLNILQSIITSNWSSVSEEWRFSEKQSFLYNSSGKVTQELQQTWNSGISGWDNSSRTAYTYSNNKLNGSLNDHWDAVNLAWVNYTRTTYTYSAGLNTESLVEKYSEQLSNWQNLIKNSFTYTSGGLVESQTIQLWDTDHWVNSLQYFNTYTGSDLTSMLTKQWQAHLNDWRNYQQDDTYYSQHEIFGISRQAVESILIRNPVQKGTAFRLAGLKENCIYQLSLTDMNDKRCISIQVTSGELVTIPWHLAPGLYIMVVTSPGKPILFQKLLITN